MQIVDKNISNAELEKMSEKMFDKLVKAVVDIEKKIMVVDASMHVDEEELLLLNGSKQSNLWGINIHPSKYGTDGWIEFDSMINVRPFDDNRIRGVESPVIQAQIKAIVKRLVTE